MKSGRDREGRKRLESGGGRNEFLFSTCSRKMEMNVRSVSHSQPDPATASIPFRSSTGSRKFIPVAKKGHRGCLAPPL